MRKHTLILGLLCASAAYAADTELTNYKSGISLNFGDSATTASDKGTGYMEEYLYWDKVVCDHKVVYIQDDTTISASHNERNIAGTAAGTDSYEAVGTDVGVIRYKVDGDQAWHYYPGSWTAWSDTSFSTLNYGLYGASGTPVVGTTGSNGVSLTLANKTSHFYRGILDASGDEWHTLTLCDDDTAHATGDEFNASDGKIWVFVVNPKTPGLTWRVTGDGQFYTTPAKKYFIPKIYDQTTYFTQSSGTVTVEIRDINGGNISYKINGGSTINVGATNVTLDQDDFSSGSNTLEYWITSTPSVTKTRTVVKNPSYPSASEAHGDRFWVSADNWTEEVEPRITGNATAMTYVNQWRNATNSLLASTARTGVRAPLGANNPNWNVANNALVARLDGMTATRSGDPTSYAQYAKLGLFELVSVLDPIGMENNNSNIATPTREMYYRGYYESRQFVDAAFAYDVLIGYFRENQQTGGISVIEDFYIRDTMARFIHQALLAMAGYGGPAFDNPNEEQMLDTCHRVSAALFAGVMPNYSTPYYGTSGFDGNTTTYLWAPFRDVGHTWKAILYDESVTATGFPNVHQQVGLDGTLSNFTSDGRFQFRIGYSATNLTGRIYTMYANAQRLWNPGKVITNYEAAMANAAAGLLTSVDNPTESGNPSFRAWASLQNAWFPEFRAVAQPTMLARSSSDYESMNRQFQTGGALFVVFYDHDIPPPSIGGAVATPTFATTQPGTFETTQTVALACATSDSTIYYRLDGGSWQTYSTGLSVTATTLIEAYATKAGLTDSAVLSGTFRIAVAPVSFSIPGSTYVGTQTVALSTATSEATILYSIDGTTPSVVYSSPLSISSSMTVRAVATKAGLDDSAEVAASYVIGAAPVGSEWSGIPIGTFSEDFVLSCTVSVAQAGANLTIGLGPISAVDDWTDLACIVRWNTDNVVDARNGGSYTADSVYPYGPNTEYTVVVTVDMTANTYDVRVNGTLIADNFAFRTEHASATELTTLARRMTDPEYDATISNVSVYLVTPPVTTIASPFGLSAQ